MDVIHENPKQIASVIYDRMKQEFVSSLNRRTPSEWKMNIFFDLEECKFYYDDEIIPLSAVAALLDRDMIRFDKVTEHQGMVCAKYICVI